MDANQNCPAHKHREVRRDHLNPIAISAGQKGKGVRKRAKRQRYAISRIKRDCTYDPAEIAKLLGIHRNTVRHWIKSGLATIDKFRPQLIHGSVLKAFLSQRQQERRHKCALEEFFCFRCRAPRKPWGAMADVAIRTDKVAKLSALCSVCETPMHRAIRRADLARIATLIMLQTLAPAPLGDCSDASANSDFERVGSDVQNQPCE